MYQHFANSSDPQPFVSKMQACVMLLVLPKMYWFYVKTASCSVECQHQETRQLTDHGLAVFM